MCMQMWIIKVVWWVETASVKVIIARLIKISQRHFFRIFRLHVFVKNSVFFLQKRKAKINTSRERERWREREQKWHNRLYVCVAFVCQENSLSLALFRKHLFSFFSLQIFPPMTLKTGKKLDFPPVFGVVDTVVRFRRWSCCRFFFLNGNLKVTNGSEKNTSEFFEA